MRTALCILAILFGFTSVGAAAEDTKSRRQKEKPIQLPSFELNDYSGRFTADQSRIWQQIRPASINPNKLQASPILA
jgi:hypothetical protein